MRILSKFKDYYDYVVSEPDNKKIFKRDTKIITDLNSREMQMKYGLRTEEVDSKNLEMGYVSVIAFCDKLYSFFFYKDVYYWRYEDIPNDLINKILKSRGKWFKIDLEYSSRRWGKTPLNDMLHKKSLGWIINEHTKEPISTKINKDFNTPIVLIDRPRFTKIVLNPKLNEIGFNKALNPTEAYQDIYNWIPYDEPILPSSPNDMSRYETKGFDKKTSFRPKMK